MISNSMATWHGHGHERLLTGSIKDQIKDLMSTEDLVIEAFRDIVKDELKIHIRIRLKQTQILRPKLRKRIILLPIQSTIDICRIESNKSRNKARITTASR
ncbi:MAG: hypothetical protein CM15mP47_5310 [Methanobacteriota archaeon]|nr:MAG: hypothetical protein CM15mP47_5310 [Euryarchaeota archaeon]